MESDHGGGKCLSKNPFLLDNGVVDISVLTLNTHVLRLVYKFRETKILYLNLLLCLKNIESKIRL